MATFNPASRGGAVGNFRDLVEVHGVVESVDRDDVPGRQQDLWDRLATVIFNEDVLPALLILALIGVLAFFVIYVVGPEGVEYVFSKIFGWVLAIVLFPIILYVAFSQMGGRRMEGGALGAIFGAVFSIFFKVLWMLFPFRYLHKRFRDATIFARGNSAEKETRYTITVLPKVAAQAKGQTIASKIRGGTRQEKVEKPAVVHAQLYGTSMGAPVSVGREVRLFGHRDRNGILQVHHGIDVRSQATINAKTSRRWKDPR
jgi:hypothetical protein